MQNEPSNESEPKMTPFTFDHIKCHRNKHVKAASVPLPCFWFDSQDKRRLFLPFFVGEIPEKMHQEWLSLMGCSSTYGHFQKTGQLSQGRRKMTFLADIHTVCMAGSGTQGAWVKVEHYLHRNICKMGVVHKKNIPQKYPTFLRA